MSLFLFRLFGAMRLVVPALYLGGAIGLWLKFARTHPDGLANVWLIVDAFPVFVSARFLLQRAFPFAPGRDYEAHALYFWPAWLCWPLHSSCYSVRCSV